MLRIGVKEDTKCWSLIGAETDRAALASASSMWGLLTVIYSLHLIAEKACLSFPQHICGGEINREFQGLYNTLQFF